MITELIGTSVFVATAFARPELHALYARNLSTCDCHNLVWHDVDVVERAEAGTLECRIPGLYAVSTNR